MTSCASSASPRRLGSTGAPPSMAARADRHGCPPSALSSSSSVQGEQPHVFPSASSPFSPSYPSSPPSRSPAPPPPSASDPSVRPWTEEGEDLEVLQVAPLEILLIHKLVMSLASFSCKTLDLLDSFNQIRPKLFCRFDPKYYLFSRAFFDVSRVSSQLAPEVYS
jgi:hypothetical protein